VTDAYHFFLEDDAGKAGEQKSEGKVDGLPRRLAQEYFGRVIQLRDGKINPEQ